MKFLLVLLTTLIISGCSSTTSLRQPLSSEHFSYLKKAPNTQVVVAIHQSALQPTTSQNKPSMPLPNSLPPQAADKAASVVGHTMGSVIGNLIVSEIKSSVDKKIVKSFQPIANQLKDYNSAKAIEDSIHQSLEQLPWLTRKNQTKYSVIDTPELQSLINDQSTDNTLLITVTSYLLDPSFHKLAIEADARLVSNHGKPLTSLAAERAFIDKNSNRLLYKNRFVFVYDMSGKTKEDYFAFHHLKPEQREKIIHFWTDNHAANTKKVIELGARQIGKAIVLDIQNPQTISVNDFVNKKLTPYFDYQHKILAVKKGLIIEEDKNTKLVLTKSGKIAILGKTIS